MKGWVGEFCQYLDLEPVSSPQAGGAWNTRDSVNSSWGIHPLKDGSKYHIFVSEMPPGCGLSSWLPGSRIMHAEGESPEGPFSFKDRVFSTFHHNPHTIKASDGTYLLYFNGRQWPEDDINLKNCAQNTTSPPGTGGNWHGGGACTDDTDCGPAAKSECVSGSCQCKDHHYFGPHCNELTETVNVAFSKSVYGPWENLLPGIRLCCL